MMAVICSAIPYKTPWCLLSFWHGAILLAAVGGGGLFQICVSLKCRITLFLLFAGGLSQLLWLTVQTNFVYSSDSRNPYVYGHASTDVFQIVGHIEGISRVHPDNQKML